MTTAEEILRKNKINIRQVVVQYLLVDPSEILATRPFLTNERMEGKVRRGSNMFPELIHAAGNYYCIDGHHKVRRALDAGENKIMCEVYDVESSRLQQSLMKIASGLISNLNIR